MNTEERWLPVVGHEGYEVSDKGRVRSFRQVNNPGKVLKHGRTKKGHHIVSLQGQMRSVHSLVLEAFVSPRPPGKLALHWDDNKDDNRVENLYWGTYSDNNYDAVRNGSHHLAARTECQFGHPLEFRSNGRRYCRECNNASSRESKRRSYQPRTNHLTDEQITAIRQDSRSLRAIAAEYGVSHTTIKRVKGGSLMRGQVSNFGQVM